VLRLPGGRALVVIAVVAGLPATTEAAVDVRPWAYDAPLSAPPTVRSAPGFVDARLAAQRTVTPVRRLTVRGARIGADENGYERPNHVTGGPGDEPPWFVSFRTRSQRLLLPTTGTGARFRLRVGNRVTPIHTSPADGGRHLVDVRFRDRRERLITLELAGTFALHSVVTGRDPVRAAADLPKSPVVVFFGDSFTAGAGADAPFASYAQYAARRMGWANAWTSGSSLTGYRTQGSEERFPLVDRFGRDVEHTKPDILIVAAGVNDLHHYDQANIEIGARSLFGKVRDRLPETRLVVLGPWVTQTPADPAALATRDTLAAVAREFGAAFVDNVAERWITGSGSVAARKGDGNADRYIAPDGAHLSPAGHRYVGQRLAAALSRLLPPGPRRHARLRARSGTPSG